MKRVFLIFCTVVSLVGPAWAGSSLHEQYSRRLSSIPVVVVDPTNHSDDSALSVADFKKALEAALAARRTPRFSVLADPTGAELEVTAEITESIFLEHDPIDKLIGIGGTAMDAVQDDRYARLTAVYAVRDVKTGRVLWTDKLKATVTEHTMTRDEGRVKVIARAAEIFIREAFGKKRGTR